MPVGPLPSHHLPWPCTHTQKLYICRRLEAISWPAILQLGWAIASIPTTSSSLNSLFRVLCIFRSRYLCSIGLPLLFSLGRSIPPSLGCTVKQPDSFNQASSFALFGLSVPASASAKPPRGSHPLCRPLPRDLWLCCSGSALA